MHDEEGCYDESQHHWRGMIYNNDLRKFEFDSGNENAAVSEAAPKADDWRKIKPSEMKKVIVKFDGGRQANMVLFAAEYDALHNQLAE